MYGIMYVQITVIARRLLQSSKLTRCANTDNPANAMSESLILLSVALHRGNQYEPRHLRSIYFDRESRQFIARATIGESVIVEVTGSNNVAAEMTLSTRLVEVFRAMRAAA